MKYERVYKSSSGFLATFLLLISLSLRGSATTTGWIRQPSGTMAWLHSVFFLDQNRGWAVGSKGAFLATTDGGRTWKIKTRLTDANLQDLFFVDEKNGWLVCEKNVYELKSNDEPRAYLMKSTDGGSTWSQVNINGIDVDGRIVRALFTRSGRGWAFGEGVV